MIRNLTSKEHSLLRKLARSNVYFRIKGKELQLAHQMSFEELTIQHPVSPDGFAIGKDGKQSLALPVIENIKD